MKKIEQLKKGDYFILVDINDMPTGKQVWVFDGYDRGNKKYGAYNWDDASKYKYFKKGFVINTDFIF